MPYETPEDAPFVTDPTDDPEAETLREDNPDGDYLPIDPAGNPHTIGADANGD